MIQLSKFIFDVRYKLNVISSVNYFKDVKQYDINIEESQEVLFVTIETLHQNELSHIETLTIDFLSSLSEIELATLSDITFTYFCERSTLAEAFSAEIMAIACKAKCAIAFDVVFIEEDKSTEN